jgi:hypothetical protein
MIGDVVFFSRDPAASKFYFPLKAIETIVNEIGLL